MLHPSRDSCWQADQPHLTLRPCLPLRDRQTVAGEPRRYSWTGTVHTHTHRQAPCRACGVWSEHAFRQAHQKGNSTNRWRAGVHNSKTSVDRGLADTPRQAGDTERPARRMSRVRRSLEAHSRPTIRGRSLCIASESQAHWGWLGSLGSQIQIALCLTRSCTRHLWKALLSIMQKRGYPRLSATSLCTEQRLRRSSKQWAPG